jgi:hypothetical protein
MIERIVRRLRSSLAFPTSSSFISFCTALSGVVRIGRPVASAPASSGLLTL